MLYSKKGFQQAFRGVKNLRQPIRQVYDYDRRLIGLIQMHLIVFGGWSILNISCGALGMLVAKHTYYYFSMMCASWGGFNLMFAYLLHYHVKHERFTKEPIIKRLQIQHHVEWMFLLNIMLDLCYIGLGGYLFHLNESQHWEPLFRFMWIGFGWAIVVQGSYLLVQDLVFFSSHRINNKYFKPFFNASESSE